MKKLFWVAALAAVSLVAAPAISEAKPRKVVNDRAECFPWSERSAQGDRLICPSFFYQFRTEDLVKVKIKRKPHPRPRMGFKTANKSFGMKHAFKHRKPKFKKVAKGGKIPGAASYAMSATFCSAASLWVNAAIVNAHQKRQLRPSEAHEIVADCFLPIIGGLIVRQMHQANPHWDQMIIKQNINLARRD